MTHKDFQHEIAIKLLENPKVFDRKRFLTIFISITNKGFTLPQEYRLVRISKKEYYKICKINKERPVKRQILREIDGNRNKRRKRGSKTIYVYIKCSDSYYYQKKDCFKALHTHTN